MIEDSERMALWIVSGGDVRAPKVYAISKQETQAMVAQGDVLRQWPGGVVGQLEKMNFLYGNHARHLKRPQ